MPKNVDRLLVIFLLLGPVVFAVLLTAIGLPVEARDDVNYLSELASRPYFVVAPDQFSWIFLKLVVDAIPDPVLALRLVGLLIVVATILALTPKRAGSQAWFYLLVSVAPLYWTIYFNQVRLGLALAIFLMLLAWGWRRIAPLGGGLAHASILVVIFPPAIIIAPFTLNLVELIDPTSYAVMRFEAYRDAAYLSMPWYFGWELIALSAIFASEKKLSRAVGLVIYAVAVRMLADLLSVDVARRLLELGLLAYSPIVSYLAHREQPGKPILAFYAVAGAIAAYAALAGEVVVV